MVLAWSISGAELRDGEWDFVVVYSNTAEMEMAEIRCVGGSLQIALWWKENMRSDR
jgi:hypothetical protein